MVAGTHSGQAGDVAVDPADPALQPAPEEPQLGSVGAAGDRVRPDHAVQHRPAGEVVGDRAA